MSHMESRWTVYGLMRNPSGINVACVWFHMGSIGDAAGGTWNQYGMYSSFTASANPSANASA
eukprot:4006007-Karenia_brevis.AAC.1